MTRRDFQLIAGVFKRAAAPLSVILPMADALRSTNPKFDRERFIAASRPD